MSSAQTALEPHEPGSPVQVPDQRLQPTSRGFELMLNLAAYFGIVLPAMLIGTGMGLLAVGIFLTVWAIRRRRQWFRSNTRLREVREALVADEIEQAARACRDLLTTMPRRGLAHAVAVGNWGVIELRRGRPREAIALLERMLATGRFRGRMGRLLEVGATTGTLALAHAVIGELDVARRRYEEACTQLGPGREDLLFHVRCYLECREGRFGEVVEDFDSRWRTAEPKLTVGSARMARLMEALALERVGGDEYRSTTGERFRRALDRAREARRGAYDYLMVEWEEGRGFLEQHALD